MDSRGQAFTLEGLISALVVASALVLGAQAVDIGLVTNSVDEPSLEERRAQAADVLDMAARNGTLQRAVTCMDDKELNTYQPDDDAYADSRNESTTALGPMLSETFGAEGFNYNIHLRYWEPSGTDLQRTTVYPELDSPRAVKSNVVTVSRRVVLYDSMNVSTGGNCFVDNETLASQEASSPSIYLQDIYPSSQVYNIVEVVVEVWP